MSGHRLCRGCLSGRRRKNRDACLASLLASSLLALGIGAALWVLGSAQSSLSQVGVGIALTVCGCLMAGTAASLLIVTRCCFSDQVRGQADGAENNDCFDCDCCLQRRWTKQSTGRVGDLAENAATGSGNGSGRVRITVTRSRSEERLDQSIEDAILRLHMSRPRKSSLKVSTGGSESPLSRGSEDISQLRQQQQQQRNHVRFSDSDEMSPTSEARQNISLSSRRSSAEDNDSVFIVETDGNCLPSHPAANAPSVAATAVKNVQSEVEQMEINAEELLRRSRTVSVKAAKSMSLPEPVSDRRQDRKKKKKKQQRKEKQQQQQQQLSDSSIANALTAKKTSSVESENS